MNIEISDLTYYSKQYDILTYEQLKNISSDFERPGYEISSWNTKPNGLGINYGIDSYFIISGDIRLYAQWKKL